MPVIFVHGVNTRDGPDYRKNLVARNELLQRFVLKPLAAKGKHFEQTEIVSPYWGKYGANFSWNQASLPKTSTLEHLGPDTLETPQSDLTFVETINQLAGRDQSESLESLGGEERRLKRAAEKDLARFLEAVLAPIILSEMDLAVEGDESAETLGLREALLLVASQEIADSSESKLSIAVADSDFEVMEILKEALLTRYEQLVRQSKLLPPEEAVLLGSELEELGGDSFSGLRERAGEVFDRCKDAPLRVATLPPFGHFRDGLHRNISQFFGDVFVYLNERDRVNEPGIIQTVMDSIKQAAQRDPSKPLFIISHSMGGNITYDILTHYAKDLRLAAWISVGTQVGQFEEIKLFKSSDKAVGAPHKVEGPDVGFWLNIYDPADPFAFKAAPIFAKAQDQIFLTGSSIFKSHSDYFKRPIFYKLLREHLERELK